MVWSPHRYRVAVALLVVAGCASSGVRPEVLQAWVGRPAAALEKEWGPPTREVQEGGTRILIYEELERRSSKSRFDDADPARPRGRPDVAQQAANQALYTPTVYVRSYVFWVNREGTVVQADVRAP